MSSKIRGNNHVQLNPHISMYKSIATNLCPQENCYASPERTTGGNAIATVTVTATSPRPTTHAPRIPGAMRIAVRDAGCRQA